MIIFNNYFNLYFKIPPKICTKIGYKYRVHLPLLFNSSVKQICNYSKTNKKNRRWKRNFYNWAQGSDNSCGKSGGKVGLNCEARIPFPNTWDITRNNGSQFGRDPIVFTSSGKSWRLRFVTPRNVEGGGGWMKDSRVSQGDSSVETARSEHARIEAAHGARIDDSNGLSSTSCGREGERAFTKIHGGQKLRSLCSP